MDRNVKWLYTQEEGICQHTWNSGGPWDVGDPAVETLLLTCRRVSLTRALNMWPALFGKNMSIKTNINIHQSNFFSQFPFQMEIMVFWLFSNQRIFLFHRTWYEIPWNFIFSHKNKLNWNTIIFTKNLVFN